ncbi:MAG: hypothetical protein H6551_06715 [Chitinophagales bacterium]|nr:hypothetical protein [Chitinophagaceae bacterium]MCB9064822.1 hypothetical protein [Chitinophagales bacterium]
MLFSDIPGQKTAKEGLLAMWHNNHFPHAMLIAGNEGVGGLPMSLALSQYILCTDKKENDSCGVCANCQKVAKQEHADVHLAYPTISPKPGTKPMSKHFIGDFRDFVKQTPFSSTYDWLQFINAENKQGNITAEECREIIDTLNLKSYEGGAKVQIIWRPEYLGKEGNILLKLIEEPPANTYLILVAENLEDILQTILSRTQIVRLAPIKADDIAAQLQRKGLADEARALQIGHMAGGSYSEALRLLQHAENDLFPEVRNWFNGIFTNNGVSITNFTDGLGKMGREQQKNFLHYIIQLLEQSIRVKHIAGFTPSLPHAEADFVKKLASLPLSLESINKMVEELTQAIYHIERNAHSKTQLQALSIRLVYIVNNRQIPVL